MVFFDLLVAEMENGRAAIDGRATELLARDDRAPEGRVSLKHRAIDAILRGVGLGKFAEVSRGNWVW